MQGQRMCLMTNMCLVAEAVALLSLPCPFPCFTSLCFPVLLALVPPDYPFVTLSVLHTMSLGASWVCVFSAV